jgi:hypothetical protein
VHPLALRVLHEHGLPTDGLRAKVGMSLLWPARLRWTWS